jgi:hypothetical protein
MWMSEGGMGGGSEKKIPLLSEKISKFIDLEAKFGILLNIFLSHSISF